MTVAFDEVAEKVADAARRVEADGGASPVLVAVVREFQAKLAKAETNATGGVPGRDSVLELEQAGDSAKAAAEADVGLSSDSRESVLAARLGDMQAQGWRLTVPCSAGSTAKSSRVRDSPRRLANRARGSRESDSRTSATKRRAAASQGHARR